MAIKFDVTNRWTGAVQFTATIECADDAPLSIKLGLAVKWAFGSDADLRDANLRDAYLRDAYLSGAKLSGADLRDANLRGAYLRDANLRDAYLSGADLRGADLRGAYLRDADLRDAYLRDADLRDAYLSGANLSGANLSGAKIKDAITLGHPNGWVAQTYLTETGEQRVIVGCQNKTIAEGRAYWGNKENRREIMAMLDYAEALGRIRGWDVKPAETSEAAE